MDTKIPKQIYQTKHNYTVQCTVDPYGHKDIVPKINIPNQTQILNNACP